MILCHSPGKGSLFDSILHCIPFTMYIVVCVWARSLVAVLTVVWFSFLFLSITFFILTCFDVENCWLFALMCQQFSILQYYLKRNDKEKCHSIFSSRSTAVQYFDVVHLIKWMDEWVSEIVVIVEHVSTTINKWNTL